MKLSVAVITFNEEKNLARCLRSVQGIADEIVVVDSFSKDKTEEIAKEFGAVFIQNPFEGHIQQKNFVLTKVKGPLVLSLDADEALDEKLRESVLQVKGSPAFGGYTMNRLTNYCGQWIKHCGWYPDTKMRLFQIGKARWEGLNPHDKLSFIDATEQAQHLKGDILHYSYYTVDEHYKQQEYFSTVGAKSYFERGKKASLLKVWFAGPIRFIRDYVFNLGFLDGKNGFTICKINGWSTRMKYKKLYALQKEQ